MIIAFLIWVLITIASFALTALMVKVLSLCFGFVFSWKLALGIWIVAKALQNLFKRDKND